ncbi:hypothetical protein F5Y06DRAFT_277523 [Hypoxylon sp. FL0890]|nr:hypothetical protein F5Y06DRAFT_277523 [Hypoxylon sp. FL0890]
MMASSLLGLWLFLLEALWVILLLLSSAYLPPQPGSAIEYRTGKPGPTSCTTSMVCLELRSSFTGDNSANGWGL